MRILILGSGSFAGQALFSELLAKGYDVFGINRSPIKSKYMWPWVDQFNFSDRWHKLNICDDLNAFITLINRIKPTHVVDSMGQSMVSQSWLDPSLWYETNISRKSLLIEHIRNLSCLEKYIKISTPEVFGSNSEKITDKTFFNPTTPYAVSQAAIDFHIRCIGNQFDFPFVIGRFANFYGPSQQLYRVIPKAILCFLNNQKFILDGGGISKRSFIYSSDFINGIMNLLLDAEIKQEYNFSSNEEISILELIKKICLILDVDFDSNVVIGEERPGKDMFYRFDCEKSHFELGWNPQVNLEEGLLNTFNWIKVNYEKLKDEPWNYIHKR